MKKTDLYKNLALKIDGRMQQAGTPKRFGQGAVLDRKQQRKVDEANGLNELVAAVLRKGLAVAA